MKWWKHRTYTVEPTCGHKKVTVEHNISSSGRSGFLQINTKTQTRKNVKPLFFVRFRALPAVQKRVSWFRGNQRNAFIFGRSESTKRWIDSSEMASNKARLRFCKTMQFTSFVFPVRRSHQQLTILVVFCILRDRFVCISPILLRSKPVRDGKTDLVYDLSEQFVCFSYFFQ